MIRLLYDSFMSLLISVTLIVRLKTQFMKNSWMYPCSRVITFIIRVNYLCIVKNQCICVKTFPNRTQKVYQTHICIVILFLFLRIRQFYTVVYFQYDFCKILVYIRYPKIVALIQYRLLLMLIVNSNNGFNKLYIQL